jgi:hypothetical protein
VNTLRTKELADLWRVSDRRVRVILAELEALGVRLEIDSYGGRRVPPQLAKAVKAAREAGQPLSSLVEDVTLLPYMIHGLDANPLGMLIYLSGEAALLRETVGATWEALRCGVAGAPRIDWRDLEVVDPHRGL